MSSLFFAFSKRQIKTASYKPASYRMKIKPLLKDIGRKKPAVGEGGGGGGRFSHCLPRLSLRLLRRLSTTRNKTIYGLQSSPDLQRIKPEAYRGDKLLIKLIALERFLDLRFEKASLKVRGFLLQRSTKINRNLLKTK